MVSKIIFTYKFNNLPNIESLSDDCKIWLTTILDKYDPKKGSKAFSYFSVITKNWFIHKVKQNSKRLKRDLQYENLINNQIEVSTKLFKFCDIKWDKKIFDFYKSGKRINTASISQVKKSIYNTSIDSNKKYIKKMSFLKKLEKIKI